MKPKKRRTTPLVTPELRGKVKRLIELNEDHMAAIRDEPGAEAFYEDGRHEEMCSLTTIVYDALDIKPWQDAGPLLEAALKED